MYDDAVDATGEMLGIVPALELERLGLRGILAGGAGRIRVAAIRADKTVDHQFERARRLVPVHRRDDHDAVRCDPALVDFVHPVVGLAERMILPSLRAEPQMSRTRDRVDAFFWCVAAVRRRARVADHSIDSS